MNAHPCSDCEYECFRGECKYRSDDIYALYEDMLHCDQVVLIIPLYCGNPSSLYFIFHERCQDFFMHNDCDAAIAKKLYIIGVYGSEESSPDFIPCLEKWFDGAPYKNRVLGIERHRYGQKLNDGILDVEAERKRIMAFIQGTSVRENNMLQG